MLSNRLFDRVVNRIDDGMRAQEAKTVKEYKDSSEYYKKLRIAAASLNDSALDEHLEKLAQANNFSDLIRLAGKYNIHTASAIPGFAFRAICFASSYFSSGASAAYYLMHLREDVVNFAEQKGYYIRSLNMATRDMQYLYHPATTPASSE